MLPSKRWQHWKTYESWQPLEQKQQEHPRNGQSGNTSVRRINKEFITHVFEENEGRVTKKLSQKFSRTESRIWGALSKLDELLLNPQIRTHSGTVSGTNVKNKGTIEDDSQSDPHPEAGIFRSQTTQNSCPEYGHDMLTGVQKESLCGHDMVRRVTEYCHDMVTGVGFSTRLSGQPNSSGVENYLPMVTRATEEIRQNPHKTTGVQEDIPYNSPGTSSGKTKEGALHKSALFSQWEHIWDNWGRPDFVGPSTVGEQQQLRQHQQQH